MKIQTKLKNQFDCGFKTLMLLLFLSLGLVGCGMPIAQKTLVWSPDGENAIVRASDGIRFTDKNGNLTKVLLKNCDTIVWSSDSKSILTVCEEKFQSWEQLRAMLSEQSQRDIEKASTFFAGLAVKYSTVNSFEELNKFDQQRSDDILEKVRLQDVMTYLYFNDRQSFDRLFQKKEKLKADYPMLSMINVVKSFSFVDNQLVLNAMLYKTNNEIVALAACPNNKAVAVVERNWYEDKGKYRLLVINRKSDRVVKISKSVLPNIHWFSGGNRLVYIKKSGDEEGLYGSLRWAKIFDRKGKVLSSPVVEPLASISLDDSDNSVLCTSSGRIFFSSTVRSLPAYGVDKSSKPAIFMMEPLKIASLTRILRGDFNNLGCKYFDVSPDGNKICVLDDDGTVALYNVNTGKSEQLQSSKMEEKYFETASIFPQFRTDDEISFSRPLERDKKEKPIADIVIFNLDNKKTKSLSKDWPKAAVKFLHDSDSEHK